MRMENRVPNRNLGWRTLGALALCAGPLLSPVAGQGPQQQGPQQQQPPQQGPPAGAQGPVQGPNRQPPPEVAPFKLTEQEFDLLFTVLKVWEQRSATINTAKANFTLWTQDPVFKKQTRQSGKVSYQAPDHGLYKVLDEEGKDWTDHWVCDGKAVYDYDYAKKVLSQFDLPPELQGQNITNGPLPFLFACKKDQLLNRYWMRLVTPEAVANDEIWIEAYPRLQNERADFVRATIILNRKELVPTAIELYFNNEGRTVHQFDWKINTGGGAFSMFMPDEFKAAVPRGWTKEVNPGMKDTSGGATSTAQSGGVIRQ